MKRTKLVTVLEKWLQDSPAQMYELCLHKWIQGILLIQNCIELTASRWPHHAHKATFCTALSTMSGIGRLIGTFHQMQLHRYWTGSSTSVITCHWKSGQFHTGRKHYKRPGRSHGHFLLTLHPWQIGCLKGKAHVVYDKVVVRWIIRVLVCPTLLHVGSAPSWVRYAGLLVKPCCRRQLFGANTAVGDEAR